MSAHLSGGSLGFSFAPVLFAPFIAAMGLQWSPLIMIPGLLALSFTLRHVPAMHLPAAHERSTLDTLRPAAVPLTLLYFTIVLRTVTSYGFMTFAPPLLTEQGFTIGEASTAVSLYLFASGIGGFVGGPLSDRYRRAASDHLVAGGGGAVHGGCAATVADRFYRDCWPSAGCCCSRRCRSASPSRKPSSKGVPQPSRRLMMGFAWGMGSLFVPLIGASADRFGIAQTLVILAFVPLLAACLAWRLPDRGVHHVEPKVDSLP